VGCSVKKKLIADNFSSVWDSFWNDLIESEEQTSAIKQIENDIGNTEVGEGEGEGEGDDAQEAQTNNAPEDDGDDRSSAPACLNGALTTCKRMYTLSEDWDASNYYPLAYDGVFYNLDPVQQYGFNNEYYYNLENLAVNETDNTFFGFKCMKYNGDDENPILYLGCTLFRGTLISAVFELNLQTKKIKPMLLAVDRDSEILCIDMIGKKHLLIGGYFNNVIKFIDGRAITESPYPTAIPLIVMNIETYEVTTLYDRTVAVPLINNPIRGETMVNKICVCKNRKVINQNDKMAYHEYVGLFGGNIRIETAGTGTSPPNILNIGCVVIKIPINNSNPLVARMCSIDAYVEGSNRVIRGLVLTLPGQNVNVTSIVCNDEEEEPSVAKNKTTFYVGGYFDKFGYMDYERFEKAKADAAASGAPAVRTERICWCLAATSFALHLCALPTF
jgi:hypothetical protein